MEPQPETFHLFGGLFVSDPQRCLLPEDQSLVNRVIALMRDFEQALPDVIETSILHISGS
ncbi:uncharacterized protein N7479_008329 [Penicillium vulpinum]|uniref:uncharacterized protein n=1 Tax=Penicillium vulpinum TaxID=29845 RepID=UPI002549451B|nr:uncharacterized protein N7479_008329 [Penicillium vulpinum]KAJ5961179.1 hypothetical protein N7479_008329 [Penicillium vulpinum]